MTKNNKSKDQEFDDGDNENVDPIFGYTDEEHKVQRRYIPDGKLKKKVTIEPPPPKIDHKDLATNVVELLEEDINEFKSDLQDLTKGYTDLLRKEVVPHLLALDAAVDYTKTLMNDGIGREDITTDNSLLICLKWTLLGNFIHSVCQKHQLKENAFFDEKISELMKSELSRASSYSEPNIVGVVKSLDSNGGLGVKTSMKKRD